MKTSILSRNRRKETESLSTGATENLGSPARVIFVTLVIFLVSQILFAPIIVAIAHAIFSPHTPLDVEKSIPAQALFILVAEVAAAWMAIWVVRRRRLSLKVIGLGRRPAVRDIAPAFIGFLAFYGLLIVAGVIINAFAPNVNNEQQNLGFNNINTNTQNLLAFISLVFLPPLGEEVLVRGYLYSGLRMVWRFWPALLVTSLLFGAAHLEFGSGGPLVWAAAVDTFLLSVVLCFLRERTGALYAGMAVHLLNNLIAFGVHFK